MHLYEIVRRPIITEKSQEQVDLAGQYTFEVDRRANKQQVKEAIERIFNVTVMSVNISTVPAKRGRYGSRSVVKRPQWKKAVITLAPGQSIQIFEGA
jgi:large subunit ribosomal protein L23